MFSLYSKTQLQPNTCWTAHLYVLVHDSVRETLTAKTKSISHDFQNGQEPVWAAATGVQVSKKEHPSWAASLPKRKERQCNVACEDPVLELPVWLLSPKLRKKLSFANSLHGLTLESSGSHVIWGPWSTWGRFRAFSSSEGLAQCPAVSHCSQ